MLVTDFKVKFVSDWVLIFLEFAHVFNYDKMQISLVSGTSALTSFAHKKKIEKNAEVFPIPATSSRGEKIKNILRKYPSSAGLWGFNTTYGENTVDILIGHNPVVSPCHIFKVWSSFFATMAPNHTISTASELSLYFDFIRSTPKKNANYFQNIQSRINSQRSETFFLTTPDPAEHSTSAPSCQRCRETLHEASNHV